MTNDSPLRGREHKPSADYTARPPKTVFLAAVFLIFVMSLSAADSVGFVPNYMDGAQIDEVALSELPQLGEEARAIAPAALATVTAQPTRLYIPAIKKNLPIQNPTSRNIDTLDDVLRLSPARYVDSAILGESGNVLLFGHSSHLPVVRNKMYQAFNDIELLEEGDSIIVSGGGNNYLYRVSTVRMVDAKDEIIDLSKDRTRLTLVTCNTFGEKTSRWIVEADFVGLTGAI